jgi:hypothetical protein
MTYPNSIDTFREVTAYTGGPVVDDNKLKAGDQNNMADTLEGVQNALGTNPEGAKTDVKTRLNDVDTAITGKVAKAGDTMSGDLQVNARIQIGTSYDDEGEFQNRKDHNSHTDCYTINNTNDTGAKAENVVMSHEWAQWGWLTSRPAGNTEHSSIFSNGVVIGGNPQLSIVSRSDDLKIYAGGETASDLILTGETDGDIIAEKGDIEVKSNSKGLILSSATKRWRVTIDDTGTLQTTDIT